MKYLLLIASLLLLTGCAVGRGAAGEIVLGFDAGRLVETGNEGLAFLGDSVLPGLGTALIAITGGTAGLGGLFAASKKEGKRKRADQEREANALELAELKGRLAALAEAEDAADSA